MEIRYKLYPYPVLAYYSDDYKDSLFETTIDVCKEGYSIRIDFIAALRNKELIQLISDGKAKYIYHLECPQTGYRRVVSTSKVSDRVIVPDSRVRGKMYICPFVVAAQDIEGYTNLSFHDDYADESFDIEAGCVIAVGKQVTALITKETEDLANTPSVFSIVRDADPDAMQMKVDIDKPKIVIKLPLNDYYSYKQLSKNPITQPLLNAVAIIPALTYALEEIKSRTVEEREELSEFGWYRTVRKTLRTTFQCEIESEEFSQENMIELAQKLINNPISDALRVLRDGYGSAGGDDE